MKVEVKMERIYIMVIDTSLHYKVRILGKLSNPAKEVAPSRHLGVVAFLKRAF